MAPCAGTTRAGKPCAAAPIPGERWCFNHHPDHAEERRRNASRAATIGNSKVGAEIKGVRLMVRDLVETTVSGDLHPTVKKRLTEIAQLLQVYARLAELEIAAGERLRAGDVALPEDTGQRVRQWTEGEAEREKQREIFMGKLQAVEKDPRAALEGVDHRPQGPRGCLPLSSGWDSLRISLLRVSVNIPFGSASHGDDDFTLSVSVSDITNSFRDLA